MNKFRNFVLATMLAVCTDHSQLLAMDGSGLENALPGGGGINQPRGDVSLQDLQALREVANEFFKYPCHFISETKILQAKFDGIAKGVIHKEFFNGIQELMNVKKVQTSNTNVQRDAFDKILEFSKNIVSESETRTDSKRDEFLKQLNNLKSEVTNTQKQLEKEFKSASYIEKTLQEAIKNNRVTLRDVQRPVGLVHRFIQDSKWPKEELSKLANAIETKIAATTN